MPSALLIDPEYCSGCHSCEIACRNEHDLPLDQYGVKLCEVGPFEVGAGSDFFIWDYHPIVTALCNTCTERRERGEKAACELHCLADAIVVGEFEELCKLAATKGHKVEVQIP